ncbi:MAG: mannose-6-phosphate isomerase class I [Glaciecola sp.]|jgi:mannose-6-phosphate isomerase class I
MTSDRTPMHRVDRPANYDPHPHVAVGAQVECSVGWDAIAERLREVDGQVLVIEAYPGVYPDDLVALADTLGVGTVFRAADALLSAERIEALVRPELTDDAIFGRLTSLEMDDFFDPSRVAKLRDAVEEASTRGRVAVIGTGSSLITDGDIVVLADMPRWELQLRQRRGEVTSIGTDDRDLKPSLQYKRGYFVDWRVADRLKGKLFARLDFVLDTTVAGEPKMIAAEAMHRGLELAAHQPFRVVPFFDPGPWGGQWIKKVCDLDPDVINYAWAFDCVPEENSLLLGFGPLRFALPAINLVHQQPEALLGVPVYERFGAEFPIRFDFLDTMGGGNLSLQVHPVTEYMREHFGHGFTQDESYYMLDAEPGESTVYLGVRDGVDQDEMRAALQAAQTGGEPFDAERYANRFPAQRHDHFLIPAGTVHSAGSGGMVLEISATPYIFTFKLWDWGRLDLDGLPRPINIDRGLDNMAWDRDATYAQRALINDVTPLGQGEGWRAERTGLHEAEFIDTHRHWFTGMVEHDTGFGVNVLNLVQGEEAVVSSPDDAFVPFVVHYAETFIVPAAVGRYTIAPHGRAVGTECATLKAFVRGTQRSET